MGEYSSIEWTDHTFNPWWGCARVSPACDHCYAEPLAKLHFPSHNIWGPHAPRRVFEADDRKQHWRNPFRWNKRAAKLGVRERVFCASMADVFDNHPGVVESRAMLWDVIRQTPQLDWLLLTKRVGNVPRMLPQTWGDGWPNVWLGISVCNQEEADRDVPKLLALPARVRFLSCEPLLGPLTLNRWLLSEHGRRQIGALPGISWAIAGGESGPKARPSHPDWFRALRDQCVAAGVAYHFKQWGEWQVASAENGHFDSCMATNGAKWVHNDGLVNGPICFREDGRTDTEPFGMIRVGKKAAGRLLDGRTWDEFPTVPA